MGYVIYPTFSGHQKLLTMCIPPLASIMKARIDGGDRAIVSDKHYVPPTPRIQCIPDCHGAAPRTHDVFCSGGSSEEKEKEQKLVYTTRHHGGEEEECNAVFLSPPPRSVRFIYPCFPWCACWCCTHALLRLLKLSRSLSTLSLPTFFFFFSTAGESERAR